MGYHIPLNPITKLGDNWCSNVPHRPCGSPDQIENINLEKVSGGAPGYIAVTKKMCVGDGDYFEPLTPWKDRASASSNPWPTGPLNFGCGTSATDATGLGCPNLRDFDYNSTRQKTTVSESGSHIMKLVTGGNGVDTSYHNRNCINRLEINNFQNSVLYQNNCLEDIGDLDGVKEGVVSKKYIKKCASYDVNLNPNGNFRKFSTRCCSPKISGPFKLETITKKAIEESEETGNPITENIIDAPNHITLFQNIPDISLLHDNFSYMLQNRIDCECRESFCGSPIVITNTTTTTTVNPSGTTASPGTTPNPSLMRSSKIIIVSGTGKAPSVPNPPPTDEEYSVSPTYTFIDRIVPKIQSLSTFCPPLTDCQDRYNIAIHLGNVSSTAAGWDAFTYLTILPKDFTVPWNKWLYFNRNFYLTAGNLDLDTPDTDFGGGLILRGYGNGSMRESGTATKLNQYGDNRLLNKFYCYDFVHNGIHFFVMNTGNSAAGNNLDESADGFMKWNQQVRDMVPRILASTADYKILVMHKPPYTNKSGIRPGVEEARIFTTPEHGSLTYSDMGINVVLSANNEMYEHIVDSDQIHYIVQGLGPAVEPRCPELPLEEGTQKIHCAGSAYTILTRSGDCLKFETRDINHNLIETFNVCNPGASPLVITTSEEPEPTTSTTTTSTTTAAPTETYWGKCSCYNNAIEACFGVVNITKEKCNSDNYCKNYCKSLNGGSGVGITGCCIVQE